LEGIISLKTALERARAIKEIQKNNFAKRKDERNNFQEKEKKKINLLLIKITKILKIKEKN